MNRLLRSYLYDIARLEMVEKCRCNEANCNKAFENMKRLFVIDEDITKYIFEEFDEGLTDLVQQRKIKISDLYSDDPFIFNITTRMIIAQRVFNFYLSTLSDEEKLHLYKVALEDCGERQWGAAVLL